MFCIGGIVSENEYTSNCESLLLKKQEDKVVFVNQNEDSLSEKKMGVSACTFLNRIYVFEGYLKEIRELSKKIEILEADFPNSWISINISIELGIFNGVVLLSEEKTIIILGGYNFISKKKQANIVRIEPLGKGDVAVSENLPNWSYLLAF